MTIKCFHGGASFEAIGSDFTRLASKDKVIRADVTDAWYDPAPNVTRALKTDLPWFLKNSPPTNSKGLVEVISQVRKIPKESLLVGGGSTDLMFAFFPNYPCNRAAILDPMYGEYRHIFEDVLGKEVYRILQSPTKNFEMSIDDIAAGAADCDMLVLVNPNNPTGQYIKREQVEELLARLPRKKMLFIDETYIDFIGKDESVESLVACHKNLVVLKSMSKAYALSGARVGYMAAHPDIAGKVRGYVPSWSVSLVGQIAGVEALKNEAYYREKIDETHRIRKDFAEQLNSLSRVKVYPSCANFILLNIKDSGKKAQYLCDELAGQNIYIRNAGSMSSQFGQDFIRTAVRDRKSNDAIYSGLKAVLTNE